MKGFDEHLDNYGDPAPSGEDYQHPDISWHGLRAECQKCGELVNYTSDCVAAIAYVTDRFGTEPIVPESWLTRMYEAFLAGSAWEERQHEIAHEVAEAKAQMAHDEMLANTPDDE